MVAIELLCLSLLAVSALSLPSASSNHVLHEKRGTTHPRWIKDARLHSASILPLRIGLSQSSNIDSAEDYLMSV